MRKERFTAVAVAALMSGLAAQAGHAATLNLSDVPLFLTTGAEPNVMLMFDNSGSMANIVPDAPFDPATTYLTNCPTSNSNRIAAGTSVALTVTAGGQPRINIGGTNFVWGTGGGTPAKRCFRSTDSFMATLNSSASGYLPAQYTGNYLNWYFNTAQDPTGCSNTWLASGMKPCSKSRLMIARLAGVTLVGTMPSGMRAGLSTYNNGDGGQLLSTMGLLDAAKRTSLSASINGMTAAGNTPLAETLSDIGFYFSRGATNLLLHPSAPTPSLQSRTDIFNNGYTRHSSWNNGSNPIQYSCQKSFAVLLTDGRPQGDQNISAHLRDYDGDCASGTCLAFDMKPAPRTYESQGSDYLNDVAMALYDIDLRPDLAKTGSLKNNVSSYFISFADDQAINDPLMQSAADQGGGEKFVAGNETELITAFQSALAGIIEKTSSASSASVNSGSINSGTRLFQASFDSKDWSGALTGRTVSTDGTLGTPVTATLPAAGSREIITVDGTGAAVPFLWANIGTARQAQLQPSDTLGTNRLNWLRGIQTDEAPATNNFRKRTHILGDIINSAPAFAGAPAFRYPDTLEDEPYSEFRADHQTRMHMVYAGANDGMLHAFYTDDRPAAEGGTGVVQEKLAFIPSAVFKNLHQLTSPTYTHQYFVDGSPVTGDAFVGGEWRTMLVAGLNKGGQGIYALDITNPASFDEGAAGSIFQWEFNDTDDPDGDLGFTYSRPSIVRMNDGVWAAAFGNGYNNTVADGHASTTGNAVLYIVNLETGVLIEKIDTGVGTADDPTLSSRPNGLSTPVFVDIDSDNDVDIAYAGDLFGNLWKFDLSSDTSSSWTVANNAPLFVAQEGANNFQPITSRPNVSRGPRGQGLIVVFGTGKYLESSDTSLATLRTQSFYGLLDPNTGGAADIISGRAELTAQTIDDEVNVDADPETDLRITSANALGATSRGWYLDLESPSGPEGEMQVTDSLIRNGHVVFTTLVPNTDPCGFGGSSWLMEMNLFTGGRLNSTPFDLNNNGLFDDVINSGGVDTPVSGVRTEVGITPKPAPLSGEKCDYLIFPGTSGGIETRCRDPGPRGFGRQSWRQAH